MRIVAATGNPGKLAELSALLANCEVVAQSEFGCEAADESAVTFVENALIKARHACARTGLPAIADDSGLEVDALGGAPGVHSARYAGTHASGATAADNIDKLLAELAAAGARDAADRAARFRCVLVWMRAAADPAPLISCGVWEGRIAAAPAGARGFGYDPVFVVDARGRTAAQLDAAEKNRLSHRGQALRRLNELLRGELLRAESPSFSPPSQPSCNSRR